MNLSRRCFSSSISRLTSTPKCVPLDTAVGDATDQVAGLVASRGVKADSGAYFAALTRSVESIFSIEEHERQLAR